MRLFQPVADKGQLLPVGGPAVHVQGSLAAEELCQHRVFWPPASITRISTFLWAGCRRAPHPPFCRRCRPPGPVRGEHMVVVAAIRKTGVHRFAPQGVQVEFPQPSPGVVQQASPPGSQLGASIRWRNSLSTCRCPVAASTVSKREMASRS